MPTRREHVEVTAAGGQFKREFNQMQREVRELHAEIRALPNTVNVRATSTGFDKVERDAQRAQRSSSLLVDAVALLTPTLAPLSAVAIAGIGGIANQAAIATASLGPMLLALSGVGDAVEALGKARTEPTAENLQAAQQALAAMPTDAAEFARYLDSLRPVLDQLRAASANGGFLDGLTSGMQTLIDGRMPQFLSIITEISAAQGQLSRAVGESLAGPEFDALFDMLERTARPTLLDLGAALGDLAKTGANLWVAFEPLNTDFSRGFRNAMAGLEQASRTTDFTEFIAYVREATPDVLDALGSLGNLLVQIVEAGAPLGGPTLAIITATADALAAIADSPAGPALLAAAAGFAALNRALVVQARLRDSLAGNLLFGSKGQGGAAGQAGAFTAIGAGATRASGAIKQFRGDLVAMRGEYARSAAGAAVLRSGLSGTTGAAQRTRAALGQVGRTAAPIAAVGVAATGAADGIGATNTAMLGLIGYSIGGPWGAAVGATVGGLVDIKAAGDDVAAMFDQIESAMRSNSLNELTGARSALRAQMSDANNISGVGDFFGDTSDNIRAFLRGEIGITETTIDGYRRSLSELDSQVADTSAAEKARSELTALRLGYSLTGQGARDAGAGVDAFNDSLLRGQEAVSDYAALTGYRAALQDLNRTSRETKFDSLEARNSLASFANQALQAAGTIENSGRRSVFLDKARDQIVRAAEAMGATRFQALRLADSFELVNRADVNPKINANTLPAEQRARQLRARLRELGQMVETPEVRAQTEAARAQLAIVQAQLNSLRDRTVTVTTAFRQVGVAPVAGGVRAQAAGGLWRNNVQTFARGGMWGTSPDKRNGHLPHFARPGAWRVFAEEETGGEAYIPLANDWRRPRARAIAAETVRLLGGAAHFADGGMVQAYAAGGRPSSSPRVNVAAPNVNLGNTTVLVQLDGLDEYVEGKIVAVNQADARFAAGAGVNR